MLALDLLARRTRQLMVFQTLTMPGDTVYGDTADHPIGERAPLLDPGWPKMAFIGARLQRPMAWYSKPWARMAGS